MPKIRQLIPSPVRQTLGRAYQWLLYRNRGYAGEQPPKVALADCHVRNCKIVLNRREMLRRLGERLVVAELGVDRGDFSREILEISKPSVLHLVDTWASSRYHDGLMRDVEQRFAAEIADGRIMIHRSLSTEGSSRFADGLFDLIYIDTDHTYKGTIAELRAYAPKMREGGVIAGHDYCVGSCEGAYRYGVIEAVHEFCVAQNWELIYITAEPLEHQSFAILKRSAAEVVACGVRGQCST